MAELLASLYTGNKAYSDRRGDTTANAPHTLAIRMLTDDIEMCGFRGSFRTSEFGEFLYI